MAAIALTDSLKGASKKAESRVRPFSLVALLLSDRHSALLTPPLTNTQES